MTRVWLVLALSLCACGGDDVQSDATTDTADAHLSELAEDGGPEASDDIAESRESDASDAFDPDDTIETQDAQDPAEIEPLDAVDTAGPDGSNTPLDDDLEACDHPEYWPFSVRSETLPLRVHWRMPEDEDGALEALAMLEYAWQFEVDGLGFAAPLPDAGTCGEDDAIDVFTWRDAPYAYVNIWEDNSATPWDDGFAYMVIDVWGEFGGDELGATIAHEFNHLCQTAYDWSDTAFLYEAGATYIEDAVFDDRNSYMELLFDFQGNPDWSLDHDDGYETWYMYGAALWLHYIGDRFYGGDERWIVELWTGLRSSWRDNEPDFVDSLDHMLAVFGKSYADTVVEFARWRWYVNDRDDGMHIEEAGGFPRNARPKVAATVQASGGSAVVRPMMLGTSYIDIVSSADGPREVSLSIQTAVDAADVHWVVQVVPGIVAGSDGDLLEFAVSPSAAGTTLPVRVPLTDFGGRVTRTVAITALPGIDGDIDPDERTDERFTVTLIVAPAE